MSATTAGMVNKTDAAGAVMLPGISEFSVAVNLEVKTRRGWFSDRTAAHLASGTPVVVQDTGFSEDLPGGEGLFAFRTIDDAARALEEIGRDYHRHCLAARRIAEEHLDATKVVGRVLGVPGSSPTGRPR